MKRGDVVVCAAPGDYAKPRPAVVVQSDLFNPTHASVVVCPITTHLVDAPLFRLAIRPGRANGLNIDSQIMVDKLIALKRERVGKRVGKLSQREMLRLDRALRVWLELEPARVDD